MTDQHPPPTENKKGGPDAPTSEAAETKFDSKITSSSFNLLGVFIVPRLLRQAQQPNNPFKQNIEKPPITPPEATR